MFFVNCNNLNTRPLWIPAFAERATLSKFSIYLSKTYYSHKQFHPPNHLLTQTIPSTQPPTHTNNSIHPTTYSHIHPFIHTHTHSTNHLSTPPPIPSVHSPSSISKSVHLHT